MRYRYPIKDIFPISLEKFGEVKHCGSLQLPNILNLEQKEWVLVYEELLRRLFPEYKAWFNDVPCDEDGNIFLNAIEEFIGREIVNYMHNPQDDNLKLLFNKMRHYRGSPDVLAITVARNLGLTAKRIVDANHVSTFWKKKFDDLSCSFAMPTRASRRAMSKDNNAFYVLIESDQGGYLLFGQAVQTTPAVIRDLLGDKYATSHLLASMGFNVPQSMIVKSESDINYIPYEEFIFKPINDSNRVGVVGPMSRNAPHLILESYKRSLSQVSNGSSYIIAEQYIRGDAYRININHGKVTFVAKSKRCSVVGDGQSTVRELLNRRRKKLGYKFFVSNEYFLNTLICKGLTLDSILDEGMRLDLSHDGNEEGYFVDVTTEFDSNIKYDALRLSEAIQCPVVGLDVIVEKKRHFYVDVNTNPGIDFFGNISRAYETMEHMISELIKMPNRVKAGI